MDMKKFLATWRGTQTENRGYRAMIMVLLACNIMLGLAAFARSEVVVLTPPELTKAVKIARDQADEGYSETWGYAVSMLLGNVTPENADFAKRALAPLLSPAIYQDVINELYRQAEQIKIDRVAVRFDPREIQYEQKTGKVFVTGYSFANGPGGKPEQSTRTYEMLIHVANYQPNIMYMDTYPGEPHTLDYLGKHATAPAAAKLPATPRDDPELAAMLKRTEKK